MTAPESEIFRGPPAAPRYRTRSLADLITQTAREHPDVKQWYWSDGKLTSATLAELDHLARELAARLQARGIVKGDRIAVQMPNRLETAIAYRACFLSGATLVPVVHIYGPTELSFILRQSRARLLILPDQWRQFDFRERIAQLQDCPDLRDVVFVGEARDAGTLTWRELLAAPAAPFMPVPITASDIALLLYTSGTTSDPKGVLHSSRSLLGELDQRHAIGEGQHDKTFSPWPAGHIGGFGSLVYPQLVGNESILMDRWSAREGTELIARFQVNRAAGVPVVLNEMLDQAEILGIDLSCLTSFMVGAANVPPLLVQRAEAAGIGVFRCYGSSEHPTISGSLPDAPLAQRAESDGPILPGVEVRLLDEAGRDVAYSGEGEILSRGIELFEGYEDPDLNAEAFYEDGWFRTGDIGRFQNGNLIITDRKKDIIIRGGENISSKEVEDVLSRHPSVFEAAAFAFPHPRLGEGVAAAVILRPGANLSQEDVVAYFSSSGIARAKTPERLFVLDDFPRTPNGKVKKFELRSCIDVETHSL
ncbi:MAG: Short-chain-fatty-acid--CoA ligase [Pseudomonadota bacterium]|jgi:acyl-CoA synthetase (AMP-forming)/AMP-acid ligase II